MKKETIILAAVIGAAGTSTSLAAKKIIKKNANKVDTVAITEPQVQIKTKADSVAYAAGMLRSNGLKEYVVSRLGLDTTYYKNFVEGIESGSKNLSAAEKAYNIGLSIGMQVNDQLLKGLNNELYGNDSTSCVNRDLFVEGFTTAVKGGESRIGGMKQAEAYLPEAMKQLKHESLLKRFGDNKLAGEKFLADNQKKDSVVTLPDGMQYKILVKGTGETPKAGDEVKVQYSGRFIDGNEFDSSYKRKEPATFKTTQVIKGWSEALTLMPVGSKWQIYIPYTLAYGEQNMGPIKPFSTLVFDVELLEIIKPKTENTPKPAPVLKTSPKRVISKSKAK